MNMDVLLPVRGALVNVQHTGELRPALVERCTMGPRGTVVTVNFVGSREQGVVPLNAVTPRLQKGMEAEHVPMRSFEASLGQGEVLAERSIADFKQYLVSLHGTGVKRWLPWQSLRFVHGVRGRFRSGDTGGENAAERWRLRCLAYALELWNENTGSLSHFDIDPLPHQIHLVHHILSSENLNWLIADDVGLGKTIEAGLLIAALRQRNQARRILMVVPAGLTRQWQDDLRQKFKMNDFVIYGRDFHIHDPLDWKRYDHVIISLDRAKQDRHLECLLTADDWDLVFFDEAHRLTRRQYGMDTRASDRYRLAEILRSRVRNMVLLTATPHQGDSSQFQALLELLRPELRSHIRKVGVDAGILSRMVFRNRKSAVTDMAGNLIFHGQISRRIPVRSSPNLLELQENLSSYLRRGYAAAEHLGGRQSKAIGFVMTVYRKLAASSVQALLLALTRRLARLTSRQVASAQFDEDDWNSSEYLESTVGIGQGEEFFAGEVEDLKVLIEQCRDVRQQDDKLDAFMEQVIAPISKGNPDERVLIFTEYRGTQDYLVEALSARFGSEKVHVIHGGLNLDERLLSISGFQGSGRFLVSTEAGGEGLNLHQNCHVMVNFDLPWNPMRLAQRIGRLYRYGQKKRVVAFNLQGVDSEDDRVISRMYERLEQVACDMAGVDASSSEDLVADIMGELAGLMDVESILEDAGKMRGSRTEEEIEQALDHARNTASLHENLFKHAASFDAESMKGELQMGKEHLQAFVLGMLHLLGATVSNSRKAPGRVWRVEGLDKATLPRLPLSGRFTFERDLPIELGAAAVLDMDTPLVKELLRVAKSYDFQGLTARLVIRGHSEAAAAMLCWQDGFGQRSRQELLLLTRNLEGNCVPNSADVSAWLLNVADEGHYQVDKDAGRAFLEAAAISVEARLGERSNSRLQPESIQWLAAGWSHSPPVVPLP